MVAGNRHLSKLRLREEASRCLDRLATWIATRTGCPESLAVSGLYGRLSIALVRAMLGLYWLSRRCFIIIMALCVLGQTPEVTLTSGDVCKDAAILEMTCNICGSRAVAWKGDVDQVRFFAGDNKTSQSFLLTKHVNCSGNISWAAADNQSAQSIMSCQSKDESANTNTSSDINCSGCSGGFLLHCSLGSSSSIILPLAIYRRACTAAVDPNTTAVELVNSSVVSESTTPVTKEEFSKAKVIPKMHTANKDQGVRRLHRNDASHSDEEGKDQNSQCCLKSMQASYRTGEDVLGMKAHEPGDLINGSNPVSAPIVVALTTLPDEARARLRKKADVAYFIAKEKLSSRKYPSI
ncbi:hypothetical protein EMCRGX_G012252 [Ephydatia muelleri]